MRLILLVAVCLVASASALVEVQSLFDFHERVGIPAATKIREAEEKIFGQEYTGEDIFADYVGDSFVDDNIVEDNVVNENIVEDNIVEDSLVENNIVEDNIAEENVVVDTFAEDTADARIVGGSIAPPDAHPYLGGLLITFVNAAGTSACGSSLVSTNRLVTAAHCWFDGRRLASQFVVVLGSHYLFFGGIRIPTSNVVMHPQWTPSTLANDVAVIYLPTRVFTSASVQPISLPVNNQWESFAGEWSVAAGYGKTSDQQQGISVGSTVSHVGLQVISVAQCQAVFGFWAQPSNVCTNGAGGVGICGGDSGGPLFIERSGQRILIGVSSFVAAAGCELGFPSAFARVTSFLDFFMQHI